MISNPLRTAACTSCLLLMLAACASAAEKTPATLSPSVGTEGLYLLKHDGPLQVRPQSEKSPIAVRIARVVPLDDTLQYELRYIATRAGDYDLTDCLLTGDGRPLASSEPLAVHVRGLLPAANDGSLAPLDFPHTSVLWRYRWWLALALWIWLLPLLRWLAVWMRSPGAVVAEPAPAEESLADQLRPLVELALAGQLDSAGLARLEVLLVAHWRQRLGLAAESMSSVLGQLRCHPEAGRMLAEIEGWLYQVPGRHHTDVAVLLEPYRKQQPVDAVAMALAGATP